MFTNVIMHLHVPADVSMYLYLYTKVRFIYMCIQMLSCIYICIQMLACLCLFRASVCKSTSLFESLKMKFDFRMTTAKRRDEATMTKSDLSRG